MPSVIEALVVTLGLDASQYRKEAAQARADQGKVVEQSDKMAKRLESDGKRMSGSIRGLRNEVAGLLLAFTGAATLTGFARSILDNDAAVGRLAVNLGMATEQVSAWQGAIKRVGGDARDADAALQSMARAFQSYKLTGTTGNDADFQGLGVSLNDLQNPATALLKIAEASERMSRPEFVARAGRLGLSDATINLLGKGRAGVEALVDEQAKLGVATDESSRAAQHLQERLAVMESLLREKLRPILQWIVEKTIEWVGSTDNLSVAATALLVVLGGLALWVIAAAAPWIALATAIALVLTNLGRLKDVVARLMVGDFKGAWAAISQPTAGGGLARPDAVSDNWIDTVRANNAHIGAGSGDLFERLIRQESGGRAGISGPMTRYGQAHGMTQMLDGTARLMARKLGTAWRPDLMRSKTAEGEAYQRLLGRAYLQEGLDRYAGNEEKALMYYHGGPNERLWGAKTQAYARSILGMNNSGGDMRRGMAVLGGRVPAGVNAGSTSSTSQTTSVGQITVYVPNGDPNTIANGIRDAIGKRGLVVQSGSGMVP